MTPAAATAAAGRGFWCLTALSTALALLALLAICLSASAAVGIRQARSER